MSVVTVSSTGLSQATLHWQRFWDDCCILILPWHALERRTKRS